MARIRYIKPEFFEDEILAVLPERVQLLFIGLWCHMDRDGVVKYSPAVLKGKIFPHTDIPKDQFESMIEALIREKRIHKFEYEGKTYLHCVNFSKHQMVNKNERPKYKIPKAILESTVVVQYKYSSATEQVSKELATSNQQLATSNGNTKTENDDDHVRTFENSFDQKSLDEIQGILNHVFENKVPPDLARAKARLLTAYGTCANFRACMTDIYSREKADSSKNDGWRNYLCVAIKKQAGLMSDVA